MFQLVCRSMDATARAIQGGTGMSCDKKEMIEMLIKLLKATNDKNTKAMLLQNYIAVYGAVPNEYGNVIKELLEGVKE